MRLRARQVAAALLLDALLGEPPASLHPVVWMGRTISHYERRALAWKNPRHRSISGAVLALALPTLVCAGAGASIWMTPKPLRWPLEVIFLSSALSMRGLATAAAAVERKLQNGDLEAARTCVGEFVGRDTDALSEEEVARAAVESVAENTSDGIVAPMLYGLFLGAPGALTYKAVNTLDSMIGYREAPYAEFGWASARLDDFANLFPARLTALLAAVASGRLAATLSSVRRYGPLTSSPNAGWAEAAFAGALGIRLGGTNHYGGVMRVGPVIGEGRRPGPEDIRRAVVLMRSICIILAGFALLAGAVRRG
ncbi:MAG: cobalamin biosynthesis protein CobD [Rubrobacter sp.]|nr:cobalamin biosynthesis protein CobD [Rubrobacter sp.]